MKLELSFPVLLSAKPHGSRHRRDIHLTSRREYEVAEYSESDCEKVVLRNNRGEVSDEREIHLRRVGGRLYRPIGPVETAIEKYFSAPFGMSMESEFANSNINFIFETRLRLQQQLGLRGKRTWPPPSAEFIDSRNHVILENEIDTFSDIAVDEYGEVVLSTAQSASALVVTEGSLWVETLPPCITVALIELYPGNHVVMIQSGFASDTPSFHFGATMRRFNMEQIQAAENYAQELVGLTAKKKTRINDMAWGASENMGFDVGESDAEHVRRIARDMAYACVVTAHRKPELAATLNASERELLSECRGKLLTENSLLGMKFDIPEIGLDLLQIWRSLGMPMAGETLLLKPVALLDRYLEQTLEAFARITVMPTKATPSP